jgi:tetratricopeptide (TPR) repeat protein
MFSKKSLAICMLLPLVCLVPALAEQDYAEAVALYQNRNYSAAAERFALAWRSDPGNTSAGYYEGYCLYLTGQKQAAIEVFWKLADMQPQRKESQMSREMLAKIDPNFSKHTTSNQSNSSSTGAYSPINQTLNAAETIHRLVRIEPPKGKIPAVTPAFAQRIEQLLATVPTPILHFLLASDAHVTLMPSVVEVDYRIQNTTPRGWNDSASWKDSPALTRGKVVVVSQYRMDDKTGDYTDIMNSDELGVVRHELGHALDHCLNNPSQSESFKHAYFLDAAAVPEEYRSRLAYFLQKSTGGPSETFAELCCYKFGGETGNRKESCDLVNQYFPLTRAELAQVTC